MADPWFALGVVRELEEAGARYFALLLLSPSSQTTLVSTGYVDPRGRASSHGCAISHLVLPDLTYVRVLGNSLDEF